MLPKVLQFNMKLIMSSILSVGSIGAQGHSMVCLQFRGNEWKTWNIRRLLTGSTVIVCSSLNFAPKVPCLTHPGLPSGTHFILSQHLLKCFYFPCFSQKWVMEAKRSQFKHFHGSRLLCACGILSTSIPDLLSVPRALPTLPVAAADRGRCGVA